MDHPKTRMPDVHLQSPAVDFIENRLDKYHPAFSTPPSHFDPTRGGFIVDDVERAISEPASSRVAIESNEQSGSSIDMLVPVTGSAIVTKHADISPRPTPKPSQELDFWALYFSEAMKQFVEKHPVEPEQLIKLGHRIRDKNDWTQIFEQLNTAKNEYSEVDSKFKSAIRTVYRNFGDHAAEPVHRLTKLVPGGGELGSAAVSPIIGCVQILLEASKAAGIVRKTMMSAFDDVNTMFEDIDLFLQMYPGDENIKNASVSLIATTLFAVENVITFFLKGTMKKLFNASLQRENYEQKTLESLEAVKLECESLHREVEKSNKYQTLQTTTAILKRASAAEAELEGIRRDQIQRHELRDLIKESLEDLYLKTISKINQQYQEEYYLRATHFCLAAADVLSGSPLPGHLPQIQMPLGTIVQYISPQQILDCMNIPDLLSQDLEIVATRNKTMVSDDRRARAEQLIRTNQVREWIAAPASSQLLVHGNYDRRDYISGLSLFCASLFDSLAERAPVFLRLLFFCGLHVDPPTINGHSGGRAMIQSFICQLLCQYDFRDRLLQHEVSQDRIRQGDIDELCALFERLVRELPIDVVLFCIIDGIMYYEREEFREDMERVLRTVLQVSADQTTRAAIKVLLTSPTKTTEVRKPFPEHLILSMDAMAQAGAAASGSRLKREMQAELQ